MDKKNVDSKEKEAHKNQDMKSRALREYYLLEDSLQYDKPHWEQLYFTRFQRMFWGKF
ncbi:hypothetical protein SAMN04488137_4590 [Fictibacillus solisalsi]|uniref:Uncharacterized protein n=1 Tax=Fictibacillus solisalsi TaxID=459525 RepID=A0A1H0BNZ3_9BACL|nr:hypothetical protein [Fictibacillus solisalsi]SDN47344.1 hypothetical protein SAMN04488137_4590 [Fictibacillus solisalsi]